MAAARILTITPVFQTLQPFTQNWPIVLNGTLEQATGNASQRQTPGVCAEDFTPAQHRKWVFITSIIIIIIAQLRGKVSLMEPDYNVTMCRSCLNLQPAKKLYCTMSREWLHVHKSPSNSVIHSSQITEATVGSRFWPEPLADWNKKNKKRKRNVIQTSTSQLAHHMSPTTTSHSMDTCARVHAACFQRCLG